VKIDITEAEVIMIEELAKRSSTNWDHNGLGTIRRIKERFGKLAYNTRTMTAVRRRYARAVRVVYRRTTETP
jgi:hypothetical protein